MNEFSKMVLIGLSGSFWHEVGSLFCFLLYSLKGTYPFIMWIMLHFVTLQLSWNQPVCNEHCPACAIKPNQERGIVLLYVAVRSSCLTFLCSSSKGEYQEKVAHCTVYCIFTYCRPRSCYLCLIRTSCCSS